MVKCGVLCASGLANEKGKPCTRLKGHPAKHCSLFCARHPEMLRTKTGSDCRLCKNARAAKARKSNPSKQRDFSKSWYDRQQGRYLLLSRARQRAIKEGNPRLVMADIPPTPALCPVLGIPLKRTAGRTTDASPTVDAIVHPLGHIRGNLAVISWKANVLKRNATAEELQKIIAYIQKHERPRTSEGVVSRWAETMRI